MKHSVSRILAVMSIAIIACFLVGCAPEEYKPEPLTPTVDAPVIGESGVLRVGVDTSNPPFAGRLEQDSEILGLDVDIAAAVADELGLKLVLVDVGANGAQALENGEIDILMMVSKSTNDSSIWVSNPYIETAVGLFAGPSNNKIPTPANNPSIAAQNTSRSAWAVENAFGSESLVPQNNLVSAFSSVEDGSADYVAADIIIGTYAAKTQNVDLRAIALLDNPTGFCIGVAASNVDLQNAVTGALASVQEGGIDNLIITKWLGSEVNMSELPMVAGTQTDSKDKSNTENKTNETGGSTDGSTAGSNAVQPGR